MSSTCPPPTSTQSWPQRSIAIGRSIGIACSNELQIYYGSVGLAHAGAAGQFRVDLQGLGGAVRPRLHLRAFSRPLLKPRPRQRIMCTRKRAHPQEGRHFSVYLFVHTKH